MGKPQYLTEWEFFVWRHRGTGNLILHFISVAIWFGFLISFFMTFNLWLLILAPISVLVGVSGHVFFEEGGVRTRDFVSPRTVIYLVVIYGLCAIGKYGKLISQVTNKVAANNNGELKIKELEGNLFYGH